MPQFIQRWKYALQTDANWNRLGRGLSKGGRALPRFLAEYSTEKFPIIGWLPKYNYRWLANDVIAGLTLGLMLVPQSLAYADIATIPVQYGLMSAWFPALLYTFMGTTKDLSTGPTSLIGLLTAEVVADLTKEGYSPQQVASAVAMGMGVYGIILGFLRLGFLLDFVATPVLNGFISAAAIVIGLGQTDNLLGENNVDPNNNGSGTVIHDIFSHLPHANGYTCGIGFGAMVFLIALEQLGKRYGTKYRAAYYFSITRAFLALLIFTGISYAVNKKFDDPDNYLFEVAQVEKTVIEPLVTDGKLFAKAFPRAIPPFVAAALEHVAIARAFGIRNNYVSDTSQELCYLGLVNICNSFWHSMGVGGAMSRTAVNSGCKVRSPLSGLVTTAVVLVAIYALSGALYWIPKACLAAIVLTAIYPLVGSWRTYYHYWRTSFTDFIAAMTAFWVTLFVASEYGIGAAVAWCIVCSLLRQAFTKVTEIGSDTSTSELQRSIDDSRGMPTSIPSDTRIFRMNDNIFFPNAQRTKQQIMDTIQTHHAPAYSTVNGAEADRNWSVVGEKRIKKLRKAAGVHDAGDLPPIRVVVLDFVKVNHIDSTACLKMREFMNEVRKYAGDRVEVRFVGLRANVRQRFERARPGWRLIGGDGLEEDFEAEGERKRGADSRKEKIEEIRVFRTVGDAVAAIRYGEVEQVLEEKMGVEKKEEA